METFDGTPDGPDRDRIRVGVSDFVTAADGETLVAYGIGSTVAVAVYDPEAGVGGLGNAVLPRRGDGADGADGKFVDSAVRALVRRLAERGASFAGLRAKLAGGATIVEFEGLETGVGDANVVAAREELARLDVPVVGEAVGGTRGRTVEFDAAAGELLVVTVDGRQGTV